MTRTVLALTVTLSLCGSILAVDPPKDTTSAAFTRTQKLKGKVTVEAKNLPLKDILKDISDQLDEQKLRPLSVQYDIGISQNTRTNLNVKDVLAVDALDQLLKSLDYGYVVVSKDKDRYDGWIKIVKGNARGYEAGMEPKDAPKPASKPEPAKPAETKPVSKPEEKKSDPPKPTADPEEEKMAAAKLESAKKLIAEGKAADAKPVLKYVSKFFPKTAAAAEAKKLLDEMK